MTALARLIGEFAALLTPAQVNDDKLTQWITTARTAGLPHLHSFCNGLELDRAAVNAGLILPHHNGRTEGVNTRTKKIMRQMQAEQDSTSSVTASSCNKENAPSPPTTEESRTFYSPSTRNRTADMRRLVATKIAGWSSRVCRLMKCCPDCPMDACTHFSRSPG